MEPEPDFVSALLAIGEGGHHFFASCLLLLDPEELKACRLVNHTWDEFIREEVWGSKRARLQLQEKLAQRWKNTDPIAKEFGHVRMAVDPCLHPSEIGVVDSIFCNNSHIFCGLDSGKVGVYSFNDGQWVRDLMPGEVDTVHCNATKVAGSDLVVAAIMWSSIVTVWSSKKEMEQLYCLNIVNYPCMAVSCEHSEDYDESEVEEIQVVGNKVVFLRFDWWQGKTSLIVIDKGEQNVWESKTLACINDIGSHPPLATDENCIAVAKLVDTSYGRIAMPSTTEVKLWQGDTFRQDICLLECSPLPFCTNIALKLPFLVVSSKGDCVKVYQLAADKGMEEVGAVASLMKCIQVAGAVKQLIFK